MNAILSFCGFQFDIELILCETASFVQTLIGKFYILYANRNVEAQISLLHILKYFHAFIFK